MSGPESTDDRKREVRCTDCEFELSDIENRDDGAELPTLRGYAALFNTPTDLFRGLRETIKPGAFKRTLHEGADVRALFNHDPSLILGRNKAGTLKLEEDSKGLKVEIQPPNTELGRSVVESIKRGDVSQMSFAFSVVKRTEEDLGEGQWEWTLEDVELFDVSPVTFPAYPDTTISAREWEVRKAAMSPDKRNTIPKELSLVNEQTRLDIRKKVAQLDAMKVEQEKRASQRNGNS